MGGPVAGRPHFTTITPAHFVTIMQAVGRSVTFLSHPGKAVLVVSTCLRMARSIRRHSSSERSNNTNPKASMRSGLLQEELCDVTGSLRTLVLALSHVALLDGEDLPGTLGEVPCRGHIGEQDRAARLFLPLRAMHSV